MGTVLHIVPDLGLNGAAKQVSLLAPTLAEAKWKVHVVGLEGGGLFTPVFERLKVPIHRLRPSHSLDFRPYLELRRLVDDIQPDVIHAWRSPTLRFAAPLVRWLGRPPLVAADVVGPAPPRWVERWALQQAAAIVLPVVAEQSALTVDGTKSERISSVPFAVEGTPPADGAAALRELGLPEHAKLIVCAGAIELGKGFREAVWLFDILKYIYPDVWLVLIGDGSKRESIESFARSVAQDDFRIRFAGRREDASAIMGLAEVVWVLGERGGRNVALEAMAAARPVIGRDRPDLREILGEELGDCLVPSADRHGLARTTRRVLDDPIIRRRLGEAGRLRSERFAVDRVGRIWVELYQRLAAERR